MSAILHRYLAGAARFASLSGPLQNHPEARMLHAVGVGMLGVLALHIVVLAPFGGKQVVASPIIAFVLAAIVATLFLLRSGRMRAASVIFLGGVWAGATF